METVGDRVQTLIGKLGMATNVEFSRAMGDKHRSNISMLVNNKNQNPSYEVLLSILNAFPQVNAQWLMTGHGPMFRENVKEIQHFGKRVLMICELEGISKEEFAEKIGRRGSQMDILLDNKPTKISHDLIYDINEAFPNVRLKWLVYGNEPMTVAPKKAVRVEIGDQLVEVVISLVPKG